MGVFTYLTNIAAARKMTIWIAQVVVGFRRSSAEVEQPK